METVEGSRVLFRSGDTLFRRCAKCREIKIIDEFYDNPQMKGSRSSYCKPCTYLYFLQRKNPKRDQSDYYKKWYQINREHRLAKAKQDIEKTRAHQAVFHAVMAGKMRKPSFCCWCGVVGDSLVAHHPDYSKKLEVIWMCKSCHQKIHKGNGSK